MGLGGWVEVFDLWSSCFQQSAETMRNANCYRYPTIGGKAVPASDESAFVQEFRQGSSRLGVCNSGLLRSCEVRVHLFDLRRSHNGAASAEERTGAPYTRVWEKMFGVSARVWEKMFGVSTTPWVKMFGVSMRPWVKMFGISTRLWVKMFEIFKRSCR